MTTKKKSKKKTTKKSTNKKKSSKKSSSKKKTTKSTRLKSGIKGFDEICGGGIPRKSVSLIVGDSGSGKTIFSTQFLLGGLKNGEKCLFVTFEEKKDVFYKNMKKLGWDLKNYEEKKKFFFLEYSPEKVKTMIEEGGGEIENIVMKHKVTRVVIDSITSFALLFDDELQKREAALSLFDIIRRWKVTSFLTLQEKPSSRGKEPASSLEFESDSIILIYFTRKDKKRRKRFLEVLKMRGTNHSKAIHSTKILKNGFKVYKTSSKK